jgi:hypothetical protein
MEKLQIGRILHYATMNGVMNWTRLNSWEKMISNAKITLAKEGINSARKWVYRKAFLSSKWLSLPINNRYLTPVQSSLYDNYKAVFIGYK